MSCPAIPQRSQSNAPTDLRPKGVSSRRHTSVTQALYTQGGKLAKLAPTMCTGHQGEAKKAQKTPKLTQSSVQQLISQNKPLRITISALIAIKNNQFITLPPPQGRTHRTAPPQSKKTMKLKQESADAQPPPKNPPPSIQRKITMRKPHHNIENLNKKRGRARPRMPSTTNPRMPKNHTTL